MSRRRPPPSDAPPLLAQALLAGASAQLRNVATVGGNLLQRTRCAYFQDVTKPCNKRRPGSRAARPSRATTATSRSSATPSTASPRTRATWPSRWPRSAPRSRCSAPDGDADDPDPRPAPPARRRPDARHRARARRADHRDHRAATSPGAARYRKVRDRASYAFALVSIAVRGRRPRRRRPDARIALGGVAHVPWRAERAEAALRGNRATPARSRRPPTPSSQPGRSRCATTPSRSRSPAT